MRTFSNADLTKSGGRWVHSGNGKRWHVVRPAAARAECGRVMLDGPTRYYEPAQVPLADVCRSCAGRHYELAKALGLFDADHD